MNELKKGETYQINYNCEFDPRRSYKGLAIFVGSHKGNLLFDLLDPPHEKKCCFHLEDIVGYRLFSFCPDKVTRITIVGENGREYEKWFNSCDVSLQDDGRTVKFFTK